MEAVAHARPFEPERELATVPEAARIHDPIEHTNAMTGLLVGIVAGAVVGALIVGTGGGALVVAAGVAGGMAAGGGIGEVVGSLAMLGGTVTGAIQTGSATVRINGLGAARCHYDGGDIDACEGMPPFAWPEHAVNFLAQGSKAVSVDRQPAARVGDLTQCSAKISAGSSNVIIGGDPVTTMEVEGEVPEWINTALLVVGVGSAVILGGPVVAAVGMAGSMSGGFVGSWLGGKYFDEGSDKQKIMGLLGSIFGGALGASCGVRPAAWLGNKIGGSLGGFVRTGVAGRPGRAGALAEQRAAEVRTMSKKQQEKRKASSAAVDRTNPTRYAVKTSGDTPESPLPKAADVHPDLKARYPSRSKRDWHIENCAEFKAVNDALHKGAKLENLDVSTVETRTGKPMARCPNCAQTTRGSRVNTDDAKWGYPGGVIGGSSAEEYPDPFPKQGSRRP